MKKDNDYLDEPEDDVVDVDDFDLTYGEDGDDNYGEDDDKQIASVDDVNIMLTNELMFKEVDRGYLHFLYNHTEYRGIPMAKLSNSFFVMKIDNEVLKKFDINLITVLDE